MDQLNNYWNIIKKILEEESHFEYSDQPGLNNLFIQSKNDNHFLFFTTGMHQHVYYHTLVYHFEKKGGKIWIHENNTDEDIIEKLKAIPKNVFYVPFLEEELEVTA